MHSLNMDLAFIIYLCTNKNFIDADSNPSAEKITSDMRSSHLHAREVADPLVAILGRTATVPVASAAVAVQLCPQAYPLGQHPPPSSSAQLYQPCAQLPLPNADLTEPVSEPAGPKMTTPFALATVFESGVGQEVRAQSRPTRQQPP
jgi:hypothetical protein